VRHEHAKNSAENKEQNDENAFSTADHLRNAFEWFPTGVERICKNIEISSDPIQGLMQDSNRRSYFNVFYVPVGTSDVSASLVEFSSCLNRSTINPPHTMEKANSVPNEMIFVSLLILKNRPSITDTMPIKITR
jgi:hypothetical protein